MPFTTCDIDDRELEVLGFAKEYLREFRAYNEIAGAGKDNPESLMVRRAYDQLALTSQLFIAACERAWPKDEEE